MGAEVAAPMWKGIHARRKDRRRLFPLAQHAGDGGKKNTGVACLSRSSNHPVTQAQKGWGVGDFWGLFTLSHV